MSRHIVRKQDVANFEDEELAKDVFKDIDREYYELLKTASNPWKIAVETLKDRPDAFFG